MQKTNLFHSTESSGSPIPFQPDPPYRILVVDHDPYDCHLSADALIRHGYEVNAAEDGAAGWKELQSCNYHLLITEHDLPKLTGVELVRKLRAARMALPVVMAAGKLPTRALARNPSLQFAATFLKPMPVDVLLHTVRIILRAADSPRREIVPPSYPQHQSSAGGSQPRIFAAATGVTARVLQEINEGYVAYPEWGLNE